MKNREPIDNGDGTHRVPLDKRGELFAIIDSDDAERVGQYTWRATPVGQYDYVKSNDGAGTISLSTFITGNRGDRHLRYLNRNTLDCRKSNLVRRKNG